MKLEIVQNDQQLKDAFYIRKTIFVQEQNVPIKEEIDEFEAESTHFVLYND